MSGFWAVIDNQLDRLRDAKTAQDVVDIIGKVPGVGVGDAFFAGGGGDRCPDDVLILEAGWQDVWREAPYHWCIEAPDGTRITYVEGDIFLGGEQCEQ